MSSFFNSKKFQEIKYFFFKKSLMVKLLQNPTKYGPFFRRGLRR